MNNQETHVLVGNSLRNTKQEDKMRMEEILQLVTEKNASLIEFIIGVLSLGLFQRDQLEVLKEVLTSLNEGHLSEIAEDLSFSMIRQKNNKFMGTFLSILEDGIYGETQNLKKFERVKGMVFDKHGSNLRHLAKLF